MSDPTTPEQRLPLPDPNGGCVCTWHTQDAGCGYTEVIPEYEPACPEHSTHLYDPRTGMWIDDPRQAPCVMTHTPPSDFAQCETHDETFPLGETCRFHERDMVEVLFEAADEQRMRAVRAELELERAARALARVRDLADCQQMVGAGEIFDALGGGQ
ncbi:hypothetical protein [Rhodococcus rhodochrous]|uniref:hypothetical protein n=1 Tax=Rhodococcus rhodochrous TaxID=1829 RepID=UPI0003156EEC|nr:hypothetical protein [Rhodococcus rhodochrous]